jgi:hypothetical protein
MAWGNSWDDKEEDAIINLKLTYHGELVEIACFKVGTLAIHKALDNWGWTVSHIPTLTKFNRAFPDPDCKNYTKDQLIKWCRAIQAEKPELWEPINRLTPENYKDKKYSRWSLMEWCQSVGIEDATT